VIGTSIKIETKTNENALENNGKIMTEFRGCKNLTRFFSHFLHVKQDAFVFKNN